MAYTTIDKPTDYFNTVTWSGDDTSPRNITSVGFQPDLVWGKVRSRIGNHWLIDSNRGTTGSLYKVLNADNTDIEQTTNNDGTTAYGIVTTIGSDGFTVADGNQGDLNVNNTGDTYVAWNWLAGGTASSNTDGSITSSVSANTTAGFSIVSYTGTGSVETIGHGLGAEPKMIIIKSRSNPPADHWWVYHNTLGNGKSIYLNLTSASGSTNDWNSTSPTSSVFTINGAQTGIGYNGGTFIAYCFAEKKGFSKMGSYVGNGSSDGSFVFCGFKPALVIGKSTGRAEDWFMFDSTRSPENVVDNYLAPNTSYAENSSLATFDFLSNGFKLRTSGSYSNFSGDTLIYMAFAENPFVTSTGIPTTAR